MKKEEYNTILNKITTRANEPDIKKIDNYVRKLKKENREFIRLNDACDRVIDKMNTAEFNQEELDNITSELNKKGFYKSMRAEKAIYRDCILKASYNYMAYILQDLFNEYDHNKIIEFIEYDKSKRGQHWLEDHFISIIYGYSTYIRCSYYLNGWDYSGNYDLYLHEDSKTKTLKFELLTLKQVGLLLKKIDKENKKIEQQLKSIYENVIEKNYLYRLTENKSFIYNYGVKIY